jgi:hypothetical protein
MRQTLHIFRKDVQHFWPYAAVVLALTATLACLDPHTTPFYRPWSVDYIVDTIHWLVLPLAWWFTIAAVVHDETPAGDRQFWITRPYSWKSVVAAKTLFVLVFLMAPYFVTDCIVLSAKGFPPSGLLPGLLIRECLLAVVLMLPAFLLAAVTRGMREFVLGLLVVGVALVGLIEYSQFHQSHPMLDQLALSGSSGMLWRAVGWVSGLCPAVLLALVGWQYARRRTIAVRAIAAVAAAWALLPFPSASALALKEPSAAGHREISVTFAPDRGALPPDGRWDERSKVQVDVPIDVAGQDPELLECGLVSVDVIPQDGAPWHSGWNQGTYAMRHGGKDWIEMRFDGALLQRLAAGPVALRAVLAVAVFDRQSVRFRPNSRWQAIPGFGTIEVETSGSDNVLVRRVPLRDPVARWSYTIEQPGKGILGQDGNSNWFASWFGMSPIAEMVLFGPTAPPLNALPPDAEIVFTVGRPVALLRRDLAIPAIRLSDYVVAPR